MTNKDRLMAIASKHMSKETTKPEVKMDGMEVAKKKYIKKIKGMMKK